MDHLTWSKREKTTILNLFQKRITPLWCPGSRREPPALPRTRWVTTARLSTSQGLVMKCTTPRSETLTVTLAAETSRFKRILKIRRCRRQNQSRDKTNSASIQIWSQRKRRWAFTKCSSTRARAPLPNRCKPSRSGSRPGYTTPCRIITETILGICCPLSQSSASSPSSRTTIWTKWPRKSNREP